MLGDRAAGLVMNGTDGLFSAMETGERTERQTRAPERAPVERGKT